MKYRQARVNFSDMRGETNTRLLKTDLDYRFSPNITRAPTPTRAISFWQTPKIAARRQITEI